MLVLEHDLVKAERTKQPFTAAFIDVDGLKAINDGMGHAAGDRALRATVEAVRSAFRPYDVIVRYGGDEFLCGLSGLTRAEASSRFSLVVSARLAARAEQTTVTVGLAEFEPGDALDDLVERADKALYRERERPRSPDV